MSNENSIIDKRNLINGETIVWLVVLVFAVAGQWFYMQSAVNNLQVHTSEIRDDQDEMRNDIESIRDEHNDFLVSYSRQEAIGDAVDQILRLEVEHLKDGLANRR